MRKVKAEDELSEQAQREGEQSRHQSADPETESTGKAILQEFVRKPKLAPIPEQTPESLQGSPHGASVTPLYSCPPGWLLGVARCRKARVVGSAIDLGLFSGHSGAELGSNLGLASRCGRLGVDARAARG